ncbi:hypothetical protein NW761_012649 [Fusarium oxysporum]|nr:hypothetical protein NW758_011668 [Fusarium oxysporum]KAJ4076569.1 hypothetical protein NW761_012649 [Fusarium oxysporum]
MVTTVTSERTTTGLTTLPGTSGGTTTVVTFTTPKLTTVTSEASSGVTTLPATSGRTTTVVVYSSVSSCPTPSCSPGLAWDFYKLQRSPTDTWARGYIPKNNNSETNGQYSKCPLQLPQQGYVPNVSGTTNVTGFPLQVDNPTIDGVSLGIASANYSSFNFYGDFYPRTIGQYIFKFDTVDDAAALWLGPRAASGYNETNTILTTSSFSYNETTSGTNTGSSGLTTTLIADACKTIPFRIILINAQSGVSYAFTIIDPFGNTVVSATQPVTYNQLVHGCSA